MKVPALPFTMERPIDCVGFAGETAVVGIQVPLMAKHPAPRFTPLAKVEVPPPTVRLFVMLKSVVVARVRRTLLKVLEAALKS